MQPISTISWQATLLLILCIMVYGEGISMQQPGSKIVTFSLASAKFSLHELVAIDFVVKNNFSETITFDLGADRKENFQLNLTRPNGTSDQARQTIKEGLARLGEITLRPGQFYKQRLLINEWFDLSQIGAYTISIDLLTPIPDGNGRVVAKGANFRATFEITPRNPEKLQEICAGLLTQIATSQTYQQSKDAATKLSFIQDSVAVPFLEQVLKMNKMVERTAIEGLGRVGDAEAIQTLIRALGAQDAEITAFVRYTLSLIESKTTDPAMKQQIRSALGK
jgi:HEAT repeats